MMIIITMIIITMIIITTARQHQLTQRGAALARHLAVLLLQWWPLFWGLLQSCELWCQSVG
jgi:hypothetical protein